MRRALLLARRFTFVRRFRGFAILVTLRMIAMLHRLADNRLVSTDGHDVRALRSHGRHLE